MHVRFKRNVYIIKFIRTSLFILCDKHCAASAFCRFANVVYVYKFLLRYLLNE